MIIALEDAKYKLIGMKDQIAELGSALRIEQLRTDAAELEQQTFAEDFWSNQERSSKILQSIKQMKDQIEFYDDLCSRLDDALAAGHAHHGAATAALEVDVRLSVSELTS